MKMTESLTIFTGCEALEEKGGWRDRECGEENNAIIHSHKSPYPPI